MTASAYLDVPCPRMPNTPAHTVRTRSKYSLLVLSHAMEDAFAATGDAGSPRLVVGLFQHRCYFDIEAARYAQLAASGATVVVAFVGSVEGLPHGVTGIALAPDEQLASEWVLLLIDGTLGTSLTAVDRNRLDLDERSVEAARTFTSSWSFVREEATSDARRILDRLADRLDPVVRCRAERTLAPPEREPDVLEQRFTAALSVLVEALDTGVRRRRELGVALSTVRQQAEQDRLTGLHNRHFLERFLGGAVDGSVLRLCALLIDVDLLKSLNDRYGHAAGDAALGAIATVLRASLREDDVAVRWGGDEFLVLLPGAGVEAGLAVAMRVVQGVRAARLPEPWADVALSVSVGVSPADPSALPLARLDEALYAVKGAGRDGFRLATD